MKTRSGFVSNSSSTSFILTIENEKECSSCGHSNAELILMAMELFTSKNWNGCVPSSFSGDPQNYIDSLNDEILELDKDIKQTKEKVASLEKILLNEDAIYLMAQHNRIEKDSKTIRYRRQEEEYYKDPKQQIENEIEWAKSNVKSYVARKKELEAKRYKICNAVKGGQTLLVFETDNSYMTEDLIDRLAKSGAINLIERKST